MGNKTSNEKSSLDKNVEKVTLSGSKTEGGEGKKLTYSDEFREMTKKGSKAEEKKMTYSEIEEYVEGNGEETTQPDFITQKIGNLTISEEQKEGQEGHGQERGQEHEQGQELEKTTHSDAKDSSILIIDSNVGRPFRESPQVTGRKEGIVRLLNDRNPDIVCFQEFPWVNLQTLREYRLIPWKYSYFGSEGTSIVYNSEKFNIQSQNNISIDSVDLANYLKEFTDSKRLQILKMETTNHLPHFLCVSWHGQGSVSNADKKSQLLKMLKVVAKISELTSLPFIIAGDFNFALMDVEPITRTMHMRVYDNHPTARRIDKPKIDLFISSDNLSLINVGSINWEGLPSDVNTIFDHDPVKATLPLQIQ